MTKTISRQRSHEVIFEGSYCTISWYLARVKLEGKKLGDYQLIISASLKEADISVEEYKQGICDDFLTKLRGAGLVGLRPRFNKKEEAIAFNSIISAFLLATLR